MSSRTHKLQVNLMRMHTLDTTQPDPALTPRLTLALTLNSTHNLTLSWPASDRNALPHAPCEPLQPSQEPKAGTTTNQQVARMSP